MSMPGPENRLSRWVRNNPVIAFPVVYIGWAYLFWTPALLSDASVWEFPNLLWFLLGGASPLIAGLGLAALDGGSLQVKDLLHRLVDWRRIAVGWWLVLLAFWLLFDLAMAAAAVITGITSSPLDPNWSLVRQPQALMFVLLLSFVFPAVEEIGLRGYYLDALQAKFRPLPAALVNGVTWAIWHTPFLWFTGYYANTTFQPAASWWLPMIVCHTVLIAWVYNGTKRSILAVVIFHAMLNFTGEWLRISPDMYPFMLAGVLLVTVLAGWRLAKQPHPA